MLASLVNIPFYVGHNKNLNIIIVLRVILKGPPILMKMLIKSGQVARISIYNVLFRNADDINENHHFTGSVYSCFITNLCSLVLSLGLQNRIKCLLLSLLE